MSAPNSFLDPELLRRVQALELKAREVADGVLLGIHHAPHRGRSIEFAEHKEYNPGDDIRRIDWKLFAKSDRYYVKEFEDDTNITAVVLVDTSRSMTYQSAKAKDAGGQPVPSKLDRARLLGATLSYLLLTQSDSAGLGIIGKGLTTFLPPRARQTHFHEITARLAAAETSPETDLVQALSDLAPLLKRRALVIVISDLLADPEPMLKALRLMRGRRHELALFHVLDPDEIDFPFERLSLFRDLEGPLKLTVEPRAIREEYRRHLLAFLDQVRKECEGHGIDYRLARTDEPAAALLTRWLAQRASSTANRSRSAP